MGLRDQLEAYYIHQCKGRVHPVFFPNCIKSPFVHSAERQTHPSCFVLMAPQDTAGPPVPFNPPPGVMEYFAMLVQNGSLPLPPTDQFPALPTPSAPAVPSSSEGRSFNRLGRGQGGALAAKQKASKDVTAPTKKRKSLVEADIETQPLSMPGSTGKNSCGKSTAKRPKVAKVGHILKFSDNY